MNRTMWFFLAVSTLLCGCSSTPESQAGPGVEANDPDVVETPITAEADEAPAVAPPRMISHGFAVVDFRARRDEYDRVSVIGEIKNVGSDLRGVELQAVLRDTHGRLVAVAHFYPASNGSVRTDETWPFAYSLGRQVDAIKAELRVVGDFRTVDILRATVY